LSRVFAEKPTVTLLVKSLPFMEPQGSLQYREEPTTSPYPETHKSHQEFSKLFT